MPSRFLNNININDEYSFPSADGSANQIITTDGAGQLSFVDQSTIASGSAEVVEVPVKNLQGSALTKGDPVYISGSVGASGILEVQLADAGNSAKMPAVGLLKQDLAANAEGFAVVTGKLRNLVTSPIDGVTPSPNDVIYVKSGGSTGAALTTTKPTGSTNLIQNMGKVGRVSTSADGTFVVSSILRSNDIPNLPTGKIWVGTANNTAESTVVHLDEANGRMGIGTTSPTVKLNVTAPGVAAFFKSSSNQVPVSIFTDTGSISTVGFKGSTTTNEYRVRVGADGNDFIAYTSNTERLRILDNGNVGIGITSPVAKLDIAGNGTGPSVYDYAYATNAGARIYGSESALDIVGFDDGNHASSLLIRNSTKGFGFVNNPNLDALELKSFTTTNDGFYIHASGNNVSSLVDILTIKKAGNVGIGTNNPTRPLYVKNASAQTVAVFDGGNNSAGEIGFKGSGTTGETYVTIGAVGNDMSLSAGAAEKVRITSSGNVGIGTTSPSSLLHLQSASSPALQIKDTTNNVTFKAYAQDSNSHLANTSNHDLFIDTNNISRITVKAGGNVGIGTTSPTAPLTVKSNSVSSQSSGIVLQANGSTDDIIRMGEKSTNGGRLHMLDGGVEKIAFYTDGTDNHISAGNVGIGTNSPSAKLHIDVPTEDNQPAFKITKVSDSGENAMEVYHGTSSALRGIADFTNSLGSVMFLRGDGNVGIGTTSPGTNLDVVRSGNSYIQTRRTNASATTLKLGSETGVNVIVSRDEGTGNQPLAFLTGVSERMRIDSSGNVGIGTTSPGAGYAYDIKLDIVAPQLGGIPLRLVRDSSVTNYGAMLALAAKNSNSEIVTYGAITGGIVDSTDGSEDGYVSIRTIKNGTEAEKVRVDEDGNVGIGTTTPSQKLHVTGNVRVTGAYYDSNNSAGTSGQVLSSTGTGTDWVDAASGGIGGSGTVNYIPKWSNSSTLTNSGIVETSTLTTINNDSFEYDYSGTTYLNIDGTTGTFLLGQPSTANRVYIHGIQSHLRFYTDNVKAGEFDSNQNFIVNNGNVGIGEVNPAQKLHVIGNSEITGDIFLGRYIFHNDDTNTWLGFPSADTISFRTNGSDRMYINSSGNVGIGTNSPSSQLGSTKVLDISSTGNGEIILDHTDAGISSDIGLYSWNRNDDHLAHIKATCDGATDSAFISFHAQPTGGSFSNAASNEKMRIKSNGDVGIGTTAPGRKLHVAGTARVDSTFYLGTDDACAFFRYYNSLVITNTASTSIQLGGGPGSVNNNVFVGNGYLDVSGYIRGKNYFYLEDAAGTLRTTLRSESTYATLDNGTNTLNTIANAHIFLRSTTEIMRVHTNNNVGIGTSSPGEKLEVNGTVKASATTDAYKGYIKQNVISYAAEKTENSNYYFTAYNTTSTVTTAQAYNRIVAAYNGRVKKVYIRHAGASTPTATAVNFKKHTNGTTSSTVYSATVANTASTNMTAYYEFGDNDFTFNAGDLIGLLYQTTDAFGTASKTMGGVAVTITLEYNIT